MSNKRSSSTNRPDKPFMKKPMRDVIQPIFDDSGTSADQVNDTVDIYDFSEEFNDKLVAYNESLDTLDPDFTSLTPFRHVLVRVEVKPLLRNEQGLLIPSEKIVHIPTKAGPGMVGSLRNPWPFTKIARIIATPGFMKEGLQPGDTVILATSVVDAQMIGSGDEGRIMLPYQFLHPDYIDEAIMPTDPSHKGYGYMLIPSEAIQIKK